MKVPPCVIHEDEDLLVVNKPPGWNTHAPSPYAGEGIYDWLRNREPRWANLAIIHRLDKETSGVLVFAKSKAANRSLTEQFTNREVTKKYRLLVDRKPRKENLRVASGIARAGDHYVIKPVTAGGETAETHFKLIREVADGFELEASPLTGRTHQIRVHAASEGFPIRGDILYGGADSPRLCLHAEDIEFKHPTTKGTTSFSTPPDFESEASRLLRTGCIDAADTNAYRTCHGAADGHPGMYVDRFGEFVLAQTATPLSDSELKFLKQDAASVGARGVYHKLLKKQVAQSGLVENSPRLIFGEAAPPAFAILENGVRYELSFDEGYSVGLFLDQRDNRRRLLTHHIAGGFSLFEQGTKDVLNCFAYTCGFSVCAAKSGARTTSLDLSKKYLEWGRRNLALNGIDVSEHDFVYGDTFDWLRRFRKKGRAFDLIVLDPPTFSRSKEGVFRAAEDYGELVRTAMPLLRRGGIMFASTNAANFEAETFLQQIRSACDREQRTLRQLQYVPQPPDFPVSRDEPAHLKTVWMRLD